MKYHHFHHILASDSRIGGIFHHLPRGSAEFSIISLADRRNFPPISIIFPSFFIICLADPRNFPQISIISLFLI